MWGACRPVTLAAFWEARGGIAFVRLCAPAGLDLDGVGPGRPTTVTNTWTRRRILLLPGFFVEIEVAAEVATGLVTVLVTTGSYPVRRPAADREQAWLPVQAGQKRGFPGGNPLFLLSSGRPRRQ